MRPAPRPAERVIVNCPGRAKHQWKWAGRADEEHERCDMPVWFRCLACDYRIVSRCHRTAKQRCGPCGTSYRHRVRRIFASGWTDRRPDRIVFITLTAPGDELHGLPSGEVCACTPEGGINVAEWNAMARLKFSHFMLYLRRWYGVIEYARGAEVQKRGALHFHVLLRVEHVDRLLADYRKRDPHCPLRELAIARGFVPTA